ncbi:helix-turn-helix and ligand-binding sensor domain-containing protein [Flavobacterium soyangense]|uniref:Regulator n=1 Tax=Flavobacterium soyangense TaxID=2023265 RepID=A0A930XVX6_9FLAO|nr:triple tyrosine motif-containing protein [Flavobacterium soyangense]MBF2708587.1 regulator [Flavobacterium soyangense]
MHFTNRFGMLFLIISFTTLLHCQVKSIGLPEIRNYKRTDYKGGTQNWNIDQDKNGNLYFANNHGLFQFDGSSWHKYTLPNNSVIRCVKIEDTGKIFVGGYNEFGYFKSNPKGILVYYSLSKFLNKQKAAFDIVWKIHINNDEVIFQSFQSIFVFKNNTLQILKPFSRFQFSFQVGNRFYFQDISIGLMEYRKGKLISLSGTTILNNTEVWGMFALTEKKILVATLDKGLFIYENNKITSWNTEANNFIKKNSCLGGISIMNNYIVLNSVLNGIIICDKTGRIIQHINQKKGLQNNTVLTSFVDNKKNLWLGLDNGISFININSPFSYFGYSYDLSTVYATVIHKGNLYVATNQGVFYHSWDKPFKEGAFTLVEGTTGQAWNIQVIDDQLLCAHNRGALLITGGKSIKTLDNVMGYWSFKKVPNHPNYMIGSNYNGFSLFEKKPEGWRFSNQIKGFSKSVGDYEIDNENIWVKKDDVIYKIILNDDFKTFKSVETYENISASDKGIESIQRIRNNIYFQTNNHFYKYSQEKNVFYKDNIISNLFKNIPKISSIYEDSYGNIWYVIKESLCVLMKNNTGDYTNIEAPFLNLTQNLVYNKLSINTIDPENIFIGLTDGLVHYDSKSSNSFVTKPKAFIRSFSFLGDTILFGNGKTKLEKFKIPYKSNYVTFTFSSPTYENIENIKFSYQLEGFEDKWSKWTPASIKEYTNLREGNYKMKVRVENSYGIQSDETIVLFTILPPWYRHFLAYILYIICIAIIIFYIRKRIKIKIMKNKYYETVEQRRLYLEKESKIRQEQFDLEKEIEKLKNDKLQIKILAKDKELVNNSLQVAKKNKILNGIIHKLKDIDIKSFDESAKFQFTKLNKSIIKEVNSDQSWKDLEKHIKNVHFDFLKRLKEKCPTISPRELDLSTYLLMNMSTKEIAEIMNISIGGVELARYRLRKKLELNKKENLIGFLMNI